MPMDATGQRNTSVSLSAGCQRLSAMSGICTARGEACMYGDDQLLKRRFCRLVYFRFS
jgi:hypothetical protein